MDQHRHTAAIACAALALLIAIPLSAKASGATSPPYETLHGVEFVDRARGWAVGELGLIIHTRDGGRSWSTQAYGGSTLNSVSFTDLQRGIAVGDQGAILYTVDGGRHWKESVKITNPRAIPGIHGQPFPSPEHAARTHRRQLQLTEVQMTGTRDGWAVGSSEVLVTTDGGASWRVAHQIRGVRFLGVHFHDERRGWVVGTRGFVLRTVDGGASWQRSKLAGVGELTDVAFADRKRGWVSSERGTVLVTTNGGRTWHRQQTPSRERLHSVISRGGRSACALGPTGAVCTSNGMDWVPQGMLYDNSPEIPRPESFTPLPTAMTFVDGRRGYAVGHKGTIMRTIDGGRSWTLLRSKRAVLRREHRVRNDLSNRRATFDGAMGYVHPMGAIARRVGPGFVIEFQGAFLHRGWLEVGGGLKASLLRCNQKFHAPGDDLDDGEPRSLDSDYFAAFLPLRFGVALLRTYHWRLMLHLEAAYVYQIMEVSGTDREEVDYQDYDRSRMGIAIGQELSLAYLFMSPRRYERKTPRIGPYLKIRVYEAWTWTTKGVRKDLGKRDDADFGTEYWPSVTLGFSGFF